MFTTDKNSINGNIMQFPKKVATAVLGNNVEYGVNTGDGTVSGVNAPLRATTERWTLTCTVAAVDGGTFSVAGSVSGASADATVGVAYDNSAVQFTINDGAVDWAVGDVIYVDIVRDITELSTTAPCSTVAVEVSGDVSEVGISVSGALRPGSYFATDAVLLSVDELSAGGCIRELSGVVVASSMVEFTSAPITSNAVIDVYVL